MHFLGLESLYSQIHPHGFNTANQWVLLHPTPMSRCSTTVTIRRNNCNTPFFKSMIQILQSTYTCEFYGYVNGDILLSSTIIDVLSNISLFIRKGLLHQRVLITGRRVNGEIPRLSSISSSFSKNDITIELMKKRGTLFREGALVGLLCED